VKPSEPKSLINLLNRAKSKCFRTETKTNQIYRQRFGLFSSPPPLAIGETNMFKEKIGKYQLSRCKINLFSARKDDDGKVIVGPRNFTTKPMKKGMVGKNVFFDDHPEYVTIGKRNAVIKMSRRSF